MVNAASPSATRLARYLYDDAIRPETDELAGWLDTSPRFAAFADRHRDKIRKKLRGAVDPASRLDVRAELRVAQRMLVDRHIDLTFEPAGSTRGGPDFGVTFRGRPAFNLEVTRPRHAADPANISRIMLAKLRQLPPSLPNVLVVVSDDPLADTADIAVAARELRSQADARNPIVLARGGFESTRDFYQRYLRLSAVVMWCERFARDARSAAWMNPSARIVVPERALRACVARLSDD